MQVFFVVAAESYLSWTCLSKIIMAQVRLCLFENNRNYLVTWEIIPDNLYIFFSLLNLLKS